MERTKDPIINAYNTKRGKTKKGDKDSLVLYLRPDQVEVLVAQLTSQATPQGAKLSMFTGVKEHQGRTFDSSFVIVNGIQDFNSANRPATRTVTAAPPTKESTAASIAKIKASQVKG
jgi:hypothetical protein